MRRPATRAEPAPTRAPVPVRAQPQWPGWLLAVMLVLVTVAVYWPATRCDFTNFDDPDYVTANDHVQNGLTWEGMKWACVNPVSDNWHPLTVLSHMLVCQVCGVKPWGHHLANVVLHALNAALVFAVLQGMTGAKWRSLLVAGLFALHPLRLESVAWVSERKDVLSGFFGLLSLIAYARYAQGGGAKSEARDPKPEGKPKSELRSPKPEARGRWSVVRGPWSVSSLPSSIFYLLSLFFYALGLMSKPMLVTWPFVMLLLDYWPLRRMQNAEGRMQNAASSDTQHAPRTTHHAPRFTFLVPLLLLLEKLPFLALAALGSVVTYLVQQHGSSLASGAGVPLGARVGNALVSYCRHLGHEFWPTRLAVFYPHPGVWPLAEVLLAGGVVLGVSVVACVRRRRQPYLLVGWLWFVGMLVPVIGLVQTGGQAMADRHTYLPSLGLLMLVVWEAGELARSWRLPARTLAVAGSLAIVGCLVLTRQQLGYWQDSETLFRHAIEVTQDNSLAYNNLGDALDQKGQTDEAIRQYQEALRLKPDYPDAHNNLGNALVKQGQTDEAIRQYRQALQVKPHHASARGNLGIALAKQGQTDEAIGQFQEALRVNPEYADARYNLAVALGQQGQTDEAIRQFQEVLRLKPDHAEAHYQLALVLGQRGQTDEAIRQFQEALRLKPDHAEAHYNLAVALGQKGDLGEAVRQLEETLRLKPEHAQAHNNLGTALYQQRRVGEAIRQFEEALRLKPDYGDARRNLNAVLAAQAQPSPTPGAATNR